MTWSVPAIDRNRASYGHGDVASLFTAFHWPDQDESGSKTVDQRVQVMLRAVWKRIRLWQNKCSHHQRTALGARELTAFTRSLKYLKTTPFGSYSCPDEEFPL
jgi:hypothetical protein